MKKIPYYLVIGLHALFISFSIFSSKKEPCKKNKIHISLKQETKMRSEKPSVSSPVKAPAKKVLTKIEPARKQASPKKQAGKKEPTSLKKGATKPIPSEKKPSQIERTKENLLKELDQSIAKIEQNADKVYSGKEQTAILASVLHIEETNEPPDASWDSSWSEKIALFLEEELKLIEYGNVKMKLSIDSLGKVVKIETLESESPTNEKYLQSMLSKLTFPTYGGIKSPKTQTITITFCHEI